jgi:thiol:disulfide interchange protein DsbC
MYKSLFITLALLSNTVLADKSDVMDRLEPYFPNLTVEHINVSQLDGFYEVLVQEPKFDVLFISENGRYIIQGSITDLDDMTSISNKRINTLKKQIIARIPEADKIVFNANDEQYIIHVFTDVDCPYCARLHANMAQMNDLGITVKYLASPLAQLHPSAQSTMEKIWCAEDRNQAIHNYKTRRITPDSEKCDNPVAEQLALSVKLGVTGTPSIFFENGSNLPGYQDADALLQSIKQALAQ